MKRILFLFIGLGITFGCSKKEDVVFIDKGQNIFYASLEDESESDTKTYLGEKNKLLWTADDRISIFVGTTYNREFKFAGETGATGGNFTKVDTRSTSGEDLVNNYAFYPFSSGTSITSAGIISSVLPLTQNYAHDSFGLGASPMAAVTQGLDDLDLRFKNICGWLKIQMTGTAKIVKIEFLGNNNEVITGSVTVTAEYGGNPTVSLINSTEKSITLNCGSGVQLSDTPTSFFITIPPMTFTKGFTIRVYDSDGYYTTKKISSSRTISRNVITPMSSFEYSGDQSAVDRDALIAFYNATNGDNWTNNTNWCSDKPLGEWHGVYVNSKNRVLIISLGDNQLTGSIPTEIGQLTNLTELSLWDNQLTGSIPAEIGQLTHLTSLYLYNNQLTGSIPAEIGQLTQLTTLNLWINQLTGSIPAEIVQLTNLTFLNLTNNQLSGNIQQSVLESLLWKRFWPGICYGNDFDLSEIKLFAPDFYTTDVDGETLESSKIYAENKLTVLYQWVSWSPYVADFNPKLVRLYETYHSSGLEVIGYSDEDASKVQSTVSYYGMTWRNFSNKNYAFPLYAPFYPAVNVVDSNGEIVFNCVSDDYNNLGAFLKEQFGEDDYYKSTDYSSDGNVTTLQTSTVGTGVNVILMGDGFTDQDIASGKYDEKMRFAAKHFFDEEPVKSMRNRFNIYSVTAVSKNGIFADDAMTAFSGYFGGGTLVGGDDRQVFDYAKKVPGITDNELTESIVIVIMNSSSYAGTCFMYFDNAAIAYFPYGSDDEMFGQLLNHEAVGHGFGKLLDEYSYPGTIPQEAIDSYLYQKGLGWGMNVDVINDPATINWSHFLSDSRYTGQVGIYEGALTWEHGVWRPSDNSIMRHNTGGFNAPSREAIYKRIIELSGGTYSYEDFVAYDAINRTSGASAVRKAQSAKVDSKTFVPLHEPVIIKRAHE